MSWKAGIARGLLSFTFLAIFLELYLVPTQTLPAFTGIGVLAFIELIAWGLGYWIAGTGLGAGIIRTIALAGGFAIEVTYLLSPKNAIGLEWTFIDALVLESIVVVIAYVLVWRGGRRTKVIHAR
jgi:hypothetical protein